MPLTLLISGMVLVLSTALLLASAVTVSTGNQAQHIPLSTLRLPEGAHWAGQHLYSFQEKTSGGNVGLVFNTSSNVIVHHALSVWAALV